MARFFAISRCCAKSPPNGFFLVGDLLARLLGAARAQAPPCALPRSRQLCLLLLRHLPTALEQEPPLGRWPGAFSVWASSSWQLARLRHRPRVGKTDDPGARKALLLVSIFYYIGVLALFKYFNFAVDAFVALFSRIRSARSAAAPAAGASLRHLVLHLRDDELHHRRCTGARSRRARRYLDYLLFVCFFRIWSPVPSCGLTRCCAARARPVPTRTASARPFEIAIGLTKRCHRRRARGQPGGARIRQSGALFVGGGARGHLRLRHADLRGLLRLQRRGHRQRRPLRLRASRELRRSLSANSLQDFWRRWHISLSTWLRDYLYIPLGGSKGGAIRTIATDDHHAASGTLAWGILELRHLGRASRRGPRRHSDLAARQIRLPLRAPLAVLLTFHYVCFCMDFLSRADLCHAR